MSIRQLERLKYLRIHEEDGSYYGDLPLAIDAHNVSMQNKFDLQATIGDIDYSTEQDITTNLRKIKDKIEGIDENLLSIEETKADSAEINSKVDNLTTFVQSLDLDINNLGLYQDYTTGYVYLTYKGQRGTQGIPLAILKGQINQNVDDYVDKQIDKIDKELPISVYIDSSAGNIFTDPNINTVLTATVYKGGTDITDQVKTFKWSKRDKNGFLDENWGRLVQGRAITISPADVIQKAVFTCQVEI